MTPVYLLTLTGPRRANGKQAAAKVAIHANTIDQDLAPYVEALHRLVRAKERALG